MPSEKSESTYSFTTFSNIIDGANRTSQTSHNGIDPCTLETLWDAPVASELDFEDAVNSARKAFPSWSNTPLEERRKSLMQLVALLKAYEGEMTELLMKECGKPRPAASFEIVGATHFSHALSQLQLVDEIYQTPEKTVVTRYVPLGVIGIICPWNFPIVLLCGKLIPALLAGNSVIVKPSPYTPYSALKLVELAQEVFPHGILQVLGGHERLGQWMTRHPSIQMITFTGSIAVGQKIIEASAKTLKRLTLELGGNDACIVCPDINIAKVAAEVMTGIFINSGQLCVASKRIYIHANIYDAFLDEMVKIAASMKVGGDPNEVTMGPLQNKAQFEVVKSLIEDSKMNDYTFATGLQTVPTGNGYFIRPTIIDNPPNTSRIIMEEQFGPVVPTQPWSDENEIIARANNTNTGLGASVWSNDVNRARRIAERLEAGSVFINSHAKADANVILAGHKHSGIGYEWGRTALQSYCNPQAIHIYN